MRLQDFRHVDDVQINSELEMCIYESKGFGEYAIDIRNKEGEVLISRCYKFGEDEDNQ
jgi:hypothetical protein